MFQSKSERVIRLIPFKKIPIKHGLNTLNSAKLIVPREIKFARHPNDTESGVVAIDSCFALF